MGYKSFIFDITDVFIVLSLPVCNSSAVILQTKSCKSAANRPAGQIDTSYADGVRRMTIQELEQLRGRGNVFIVDVRNQASFDQGHIPGCQAHPGQRGAHSHQRVSA